MSHFQKRGRIPTPEEITRECARIRRRWSPEERRSRRAEKATPWNVPIVPESTFYADFRRGKFDDVFRGQIAGFPRVLMLLAAKVSSRFLGWAAVFPPSEITGIFAQAAFYPCIYGLSRHFRSWDQRS